jgi:hypothetical protein
MLLKIGSTYEQRVEHGGDAPAAWRKMVPIPRASNAISARNTQRRSGHAAGGCRRCFAGEHHLAQEVRRERDDLADDQDDSG